MMDYWLVAVDEAFDVAGISATEEQIKAVADWIATAASVKSELSGHVDTRPALCCHNMPAKHGCPECEALSASLKPEERRNAVPVQQDWWRDRSKLVGADWVLAGRIQDLIASRHS
jgi:hypothetical protein